ncbi:MAG: hypothetical protein GF320_16885 [Armatimonadia bacterium]|nr:hypothetical protein [Armatimonadia bacterium]
MAEEKRKRRWLWWGIGILVLVVLTPPAIYQYLVEVAYAPRHGEGWIDDRRLVPEPLPQEPPPSPNARDTYLAAAGALSDPSSIDSVVVPGSASTSPGPRAMGMDVITFVETYPDLVKDVVDRNAQALDLMHEARDQEMALPSPTDALHAREFSRYREMARLANTATLYYHLVEGDDDAALRVSEDTLALGDKLCHGSEVITALVGIAVAAIVHDPTARVILDGDLTPERIEEHAAFVRGLRDDPASIAYLMQGEYWQMAHLLAEAEDDLSGLTSWPAHFQDASSGGTRPPEEWAQAVSEGLQAEAARRHWRQSWEWTQDRYARYISSAEGTDDSMSLDELIERTPTDLEARNDPIAEMLLFSSLDKLIRKLHEHEAQVASLAVLCGLRLYAMDHGEMPESLDALVPDYLPEMPLDPFTGEPLIYHPPAEGLALYSVGPDGQDDGGQRRGSADTWDVVTLPLR